MSKKESIVLIQELLEGTISSGEAKMKTLSSYEKAKVRGVIYGAKFGLEALTKLEKGDSYESVVSTFDSKLRQSVYSLFMNENECELNGESSDTPNDRISCDIAYYDNLIVTLQLLKRRLKRLNLTN